MVVDTSCSSLVLYYLWVTILVLVVVLKQASKLIKVLAAASNKAQLGEDK